MAAAPCWKYLVTFSTGRLQVCHTYISFHSSVHKSSLPLMTFCLQSHFCRNVKLRNLIAPATFWATYLNSRSRAISNQTLNYAFSPIRITPPIFAFVSRMIFPPASRDAIAQIYNHVCHDRWIHGSVPYAKWSTNVIDVQIGAFSGAQNELILCVSVCSFVYLFISERY